MDDKILVRKLTWLRGFVNVLLDRSFKAIGLVKRFNRTTFDFYFRAIL
jgi:hypothetical protein